MMKREYDMLRAVSRTFALSIEQLPSMLRDTLTIAYLLLRVSDCLEDNETLAAKRKAELLRLWGRVVGGSAPVAELTDQIARLDSNNPEVYVAQHAAIMLDRLHALPNEIQATIITHVTQASLGMARWQEHHPFVETEEELDDYMHQVAGLVGYLLAEVFAWYAPAIRKHQETLRPLAREFGLGLQTVNVIRGLRKDYERGWVFVPRAYCRQVGLTPAQLFDPQHREQAMQVVGLLIAKAERHLRRGITLITALPRREHRIRLACMWPLFFAIRTLAVSRDNAEVLCSEAKIGRDQVRRIVRDTTCFGWSNHWLGWYYRQLARPRSVRSAGASAAS